MNATISDLYELSASDLMVSPVITVEEDLPLREAATVLLDNHIHGAPVTGEDGEVVGVLSVTDLARYERETELDIVNVTDYYHLRDKGREAEIPWSKGFHIESSNGATARDLMTPSVITVHEDTLLPDIINTFLRFGVHRALVVREADKQALGIVSETDILKAIQGTLLA